MAPKSARGQRAKSSRFALQFWVAKFKLVKKLRRFKVYWKFHIPTLYFVFIDVLSNVSEYDFYLFDFLGNERWTVNGNMNVFDDPVRKEGSWLKWLCSNFDIEDSISGDLTDTRGQGTCHCTLENMTYDCFTFAKIHSDLGGLAQTNFCMDIIRFFTRKSEQSKFNWAPPSHYLLVKCEL